MEEMTGGVKRWLIESAAASTIDIQHWLHRGIDFVPTGIAPFVYRSSTYGLRSG